MQNDGLAEFFARLFHRGPPPPVASVHYVVGAGYAAGGVWYYPSESFSYDRTGIAEIAATAAGTVTADGEIYDPTAILAAHQTLQLPAVLRVTNLANGRQALLRLDDRGPDSPARVLAVSPRAALLLGFAPDGTAPVRVEVEAAPSQAMARALDGRAGRIEVATAPVTGVQSDALPPPPGVRGSAGRQDAGATTAPEAEPAPDSVPLRLPETVVMVPPAAVTYWIEAGSFGRSGYARRRAAQLADTGAQERIVRSGGQTSYTVRIGPIDSVARVDQLMQLVVRDGVSDARVVVE